MEWSFGFVIQSILLGVGLAMDAFSVSLANGLNEPGIKVRKMCLIAGIFAVFQGLMPLTGWFCVHNLVKIFNVFEPFIPWIAFVCALIIAVVTYIICMAGVYYEKIIVCIQPTFRNR